MSKFFKLISVIILSLLTITCDSGSDGGGGGGDGFGSGGGSNSGSNSGFSNDASNNVTGADNEVVCTVKVDSRSFDEDAFISAIADEVGCTVDDIQVTNVEETNLVAYIAFIFISDNANDLLEEIQTQLADGTVGDGEFEAMMIIANMGDDIACTLGEDCSEPPVCGGDAIVDACGECNGDSSSCDLDSYIGLYQLQKRTLHNDINSDTEYCSGPVEDELEGPVFDYSGSYSTDTNCDDCECDFGEWQTEISEYVELKSNGEYMRFIIWDNQFSEETGCWGTCDNGDNSSKCHCSYYSGYDYDIDLEDGRWSVSDEGVMLIHPENGVEWEWENQSHEDTCDGNGEVIAVSNGCMNIWGHYDWDDDEPYWEPIEFFEKTLYGFYIHDIIYNYDSYQEPSEIEGCIRHQYNEISDYPTISGCTDPFANNYLPIATIDDGSCNAECEDRPRGNDRERNNPREKYSFPSFK